MDIILEVTEQATPGTVRRLRRRAAAAAAAAGAPASVVDEVELCAAEAIANVVRHAYGGAQGPVLLRVQADDDGVTVIVQDEGRGLGSPRERANGGFGLRIIRTLARGLALTTRRTGGTELRMEFPFERSRGQSGSRRHVHA
jgi:anti-sigma regulatory factor (Ser/Thr protein kinase)